MMRQHRPLGNQLETCPRWYCLKAKSDKRETRDRPSDDHDDTCAIVLTNFCVSAMGVHMVNST